MADPDGDRSGGMAEGEPTTQVTVAEAQQRLSELLAAVEAGETVTIETDQGRLFQLIAQPPNCMVNLAWRGYLHPGSAGGLIQR